MVRLTVQKCIFQAQRYPKLLGRSAWCQWGQIDIFPAQYCSSQCTKYKQYKHIWKRAIPRHNRIFLPLLFSVETPGGPSLFGGQVDALLCPTMQCLSEANMFYCKVNLGKHLSQKPKCYTGVFCMTQAETIWQKYIWLWDVFLGMKRCFSRLPCYVFCSLGGSISNLATGSFKFLFCSDTDTEQSFQFKGYL